MKLEKKHEEKEPDAFRSVLIQPAAGVDVDKNLITSKCLFVLLYQIKISLACLRLSKHDSISKGVY